MPSLTQRLTPVAGLLALVGLAATPTLAQPSAAPAQPPTPAAKAKPPAAKAETPAAKAETPAAGEPSQDQIDKRIERVKQRAAARKAKREQRRRDTRRALRKRLARVLRGTPITPAAKKELTLHGRRTAQLRAIRFIAATRGDYDGVVRADKALARENSRHDGWWRELHRQGMAEPPKEPAK